MKVIEHLARATEPMISFEVIPPKRGGDISSLLQVIDDIVKYKPPYIEITSHAAEVVYDETNSGIKKRVIRKRPGTLGICALIQKKYNIDAVPHILCQGFTREETEDFLIELQYLEIENLLAIRGDENSYKKPVDPGRSINGYALDLVKQMNDMNHGKYLDEALLDANSTDFCIGVAGYPEKHFEAPNMKNDLKFLKQKIDAGADYIVTQLFYDNEKFKSFVGLCRNEGINVPIIPGIKPISTKNQVLTLPKFFHIDLPDELVDAIDKCKDDEAVKQVGIEWAIKQSKDLIDFGVPCIHYYTMGKSLSVREVVKAVY